MEKEKDIDEPLKSLKLDALEAEPALLDDRSLRLALVRPNRDVIAGGERENPVSRGRLDGGAGDKECGESEPGDGIDGIEAADGLPAILSRPRGGTGSGC